MSIHKKHVVCVARFQAKPEKEFELIAVLHSLTRESRLEEGCIRYELNQCRDNPKIITVIEQFVDYESFDAHCKKEEFKYIVQRVLPDIVELSDIEVYRELIV
ncbi:antibiotic biosynthesis monooxygenase [Shewanella algae]|uniref:putative quinol monooxygenase n=1 Tax=Shewanella algae TaxID=38313 RepID=UPI001AAE1329|nr:putative quinol monooxygenase [Shewanella algae]MBO2656079.1 antibiotic biosynthesis monooxygenase [Shewanella algae]